MPAILPAATRFLAIGGRLMIDPDGRYLSAIDARRLLERMWPNPEPPAPFAARRRVARSFSQAEQRHSHRFAALVREHGDVLPNGWRVLEALP